MDVVTAFEAGRSGFDDEAQLGFATRAERTADGGDFMRLHGEWMTAGRHHAGIILLPWQPAPPGLQIRALVKLARELTAEQMRDRVEFLGNWSERPDRDA
jgi:hypothetical protein